MHDIFGIVIFRFWWMFLLMFSTLSCLASETTVCSDLTICPSSRVCQAGGGCVDKTQLEACSGLREEEKCSTSLADGVCRSGLCVSANCGDGFLNPGEACDDGNVVGGDGCSKRCDKKEVCGDLILDEGEACDDGNTNRVDGCDSCIETIWKVKSIVGGVSDTVKSPRDVAVDRAGNLFFSEAENHRIRRVDNRSGIVTTVAGNRSNGFSGDGGPATSAQLNDPSGMTVDGSGNLFIADRGNHRIRRVDGSSGVITTVVGNGERGYSGDQYSATSAQLNYPSGVTVDGAGNLFIADRHNHRIRRVDSSNGIITTVVGNGRIGYSGDNGPAIGAELHEPSSVVVDGFGNLFIADLRNYCIRRVDWSSGFITTLAGNGEKGVVGDDVPAVNAQLGEVFGLAVDSVGNLFLSDSDYHRIRRVDGSNGVITTVAGVGGMSGYLGDDGPATNSMLNFPRGVTVDSEGNLFIADARNHRIRLVDGTSGRITTVLGGEADGRFGDGFATSAEFNYPNDVTVDILGNVFIADTENHRIRRMDGSSGVMTTVAGDGVMGGTGDGGDATSAHLDSPSGVTVDIAGNLFVADTKNHSIRRVDGSSGIITLVAGSVMSGNQGDGEKALLARLHSPSGVAVDRFGNLFIADTLNHSIRRVDGSTGVITLVAGNGTDGYSGDGSLATIAQLSEPTGVVLDASGNMFIADTFNHCIRRVDAMSGVITTVAGNGSTGALGDGGLATIATLNSPSGVAVDRFGNLFIADTLNHRIRRVDAMSGVITTVAGNGLTGNSGDGGLATVANFLFPSGVTVDASGNLFISENIGRRIRRVDSSSGVITTAAGPVDPLGSGPLSSAKIADVKQIASSVQGVLMAGGTSGVLQRFSNGFLDVVAGRYPQPLATSNLARYRTFTFGAMNGLAVDTANSIAFVSVGHSIYTIDMAPSDVRKWTIARLAGNDSAPGFSDGNLESARFHEPMGLLLNRYILYVSDSRNHVVRKIDLKSGEVTTIAGTPKHRGYFGDGGLATSALLFEPHALAQCPNGDIFIADTGNHRIRRVESSTGLLRTVLGDGVPASSGQGSPSYLFPIHRPLGLACDSLGNVYATSTNGVKLLPANESGIVDGMGPVHTIYGTSPRLGYPESLTRCLTAIISLDNTHLQFTDSCVGMLLELELNIL